MVRSANADGGGRRLDQHIVLVQLSDRAGDAAHDPLQQPDQPTFRTVLTPLESIQIDQDPGVRPQGQDAVVRHPDLHAGARPGDDRIAFIDFLPPRHRAFDIGPRNDARIAGDKLDHAHGRLNNLHRHERTQRSQHEESDEIPSRRLEVIHGIQYRDHQKVRRRKTDISSRL